MGSVAIHPDVSHGFVLVVRKAGTVNICGWEAPKDRSSAVLVKQDRQNHCRLGRKKVAPTKSSSANYGSIVDLLF